MSACEGSVCFGVQFSVEYRQKNRHSYHMAGGRRDGLRLDDEELALLRDSCERWGGTKADLAEKVGRCRASIYDLFRGRTGRETLKAVADFFGIEFPRLLPQLSFEFEITPEFIADAQRALESEAGPVVLRGVLRPAQAKRRPRRELIVSRVDRRS